MLDVLQVVIIPVALGIYVIYWLFGAVRGRILPYIRRTPAVKRIDNPLAEDNVSLPNSYETTVQMLSSLGFSFLGKECYESVISSSTKGCEWVYVSDNREIYVEVVYDIVYPVMMQFTTCFDDESMIVTRYPIGGNIITRDLISRFARHSPEVAFTYHRQIVEQWKNEQGRLPRVVTSLDKHKELDNIWRSRHRNRDYSRAFRFAVMTSLFALLLIIADSLFILFNVSFG